MKTFKSLLLISLLVFVFVSKAYALVCEETQALNGPDNCFTKVTLTSNETSIVSQGTALVWEIDALNPRQGSYQVQIPTTSLQNAIVAGFAQQNIASGNSGLVQVRGLGFVRAVGGVASRDPLIVVASGNVAFANPNTISSGYGSVVSGFPVATALATSTTNGTTARYAYIRVI